MSQIWYDLKRYDMICYDMISFITIRYDMILHYKMLVLYGSTVFYIGMILQHITWHYGTIWLDMIRYYIGRRGTRTSLTCRANQFTDPTPECQPRMSTPYPDMGELLWRVRDKYIPTPWKINMEPQKLRFGSDDVTCQKRMIVRFQPFIFRGIR